MEKNTCKYCGEELKKVLMPEESKWGVEYFLVCMNDECSYFVRGWNWMKEQYKVSCSYRYKVNPENGQDGPIPVKTINDMKDWVVQKFDR